MMSDETDLQSGEDDELHALLKRHARQLHLESSKADLIAVGTLNTLMQAADSDRIKMEAATAWIEHRRKVAEAGERIKRAQIKQAAPQLHFHASPAAQENDNVRSIRDALGISVSPSEEDTE